MLLFHSSFFEVFDIVEVVVSATLIDTFKLHLLAILITQSPHSVLYSYFVQMPPVIA